MYQIVVNFFFFNGKSIVKKILFIEILSLSNVYLRIVGFMKVKPFIWEANTWIQLIQESAEPYKLIT